MMTANGKNVDAAEIKAVIDTTPKVEESTAEAPLVLHLPMRS